MIGLTCLFLLGLMLITLNGETREYNHLELGDSDIPSSTAREVSRPTRTDPSPSPSRTPISKAISYVGGKLRLLVAYSSRHPTKDAQVSGEDYHNAFDIVQDENDWYQADGLEVEDEIDNLNHAFRVGDFDYDLNFISTTVPGIEDSALERSGTIKPTGKSDLIITDGVFWSSQLERLYPEGVTEADVASFSRSVKKERVKRVEAPSWNRCGRPKNQFVVFRDGTRACARYRSPHHYLVQGEVMSFYLSRLLGIRSVPPVTLSSIDAGRQWKEPMVNNALKKAGWERNATVALIQWIDGLERDRMPRPILKALKENGTIFPNNAELLHLRKEQLVELMQWGDLILFDYITGNFDRVASMQDAADREKKPSILSETIHNLVKSRKSNTVWLIDNESGLLDSYSLLYGTQNGAVNDVESGTNPTSKTLNRFVQFHRDMLRTMCVFRRSTVHRVDWLARRTRPVRVLMAALLRHEPQFRRLPDVSGNGHFARNFKRRLNEVRNHVAHCQSFYKSSKRLQEK